MKEEIFIPSPLAEQIEEMAAQLGMTADETAESIIRNYLDWSDNNGR